MTLPSGLQRAVDAADAFERRGTSAAIIGPSPSGKTTLAIEYAEALKMKGVSDTIVMRDARTLDDNDPFSAINVFTAAEDSILILDKLGEASPTSQGRFAASIAGALENESVVLIVTGDEKLEDFLNRQRLMSRFGLPVRLEKLSAEDIADYHRTPEEKAAAAQQKAEQQKRLSEWRDSRDIAIGTRAPIISPATAKFRIKGKE
ncbi:MAG TPA: hypothetical protein VEF76_10620 [Patescibacteria group bacterium]|nr:hypothetical protein [Patescibacteria group bacterium]